MCSLQGSPSFLSVTPNPTPDPYFSRVSGSGLGYLRSANATVPAVSAGQLYQVVVSAYDAWGNIHNSTQPGFIMNPGMLQSN
jgi:hypothetical protein